MTFCHDGKVKDLKINFVFRMMFELSFETIHSLTLNVSINSHTIDIKHLLAFQSNSIKSAYIIFTELNSKERDCKTKQNVYYQRTVNELSQCR